MQIFNSISDFYCSFQAKPIALTIGNFDGVHKGHLSLIQNLSEQAKIRKLPTVLLTFKQHTKKILDQNASFEILQSTLEKTKFLEQSGLINVLIYEDFNNLKDIKAQDFITNILVSKLGVKLIMIGQNHRFGKDREGDFNLLQSNSKFYKFEALEADLYKENGQTVSSSLLRRQQKKKD